MFHNLIKVYHDGIVISTNDSIVLFNKQTADIFKTNEVSVLHSEKKEEDGDSSANQSDR